MYLPYLTLISGLFLSLISEYFSILGLMTIFSAMPYTIATMGIALGIGKIVSTLWLKQNWKIAPTSIKIYLIGAIITLMFITTLGCFGLLSKAHSDQSLVSSDVVARIAVYDEKIKTARENIDANRRALKQLDDAVDQVMGRSTSETGADKAVAIRRSQQKERARLLSEIQAEQRTISRLNEERAPIAAEVRKVEAEVGPLKYIASFVYGDTSDTILEKSVTWVIILIVVVFDPLAVILLLASQISFQNFREREKSQDPDKAEEETTEGDSPEKESDVVSTATVTEQPKDDFLPTYEEITPKDDLKESTPHHLDTHPYLRKGFAYPPNMERVGPLVAKSNEDEEWNRWVQNAEIPVVEKSEEEPLFVQNEEQKDNSRLWSKISQEEYLRAAQEKKNKG